MSTKKRASAAKPKESKKQRGGPSAGHDRYDLYEQCAQNPARDVRMLRAIHGGDPRTLGEDFCGTAALSRAWIDLLPRGRAVAVDHDADPLARARARAGVGKRMKIVRADVMDANDPVDLIAVLNFSICEIHSRRALVRYLKHARGRLAADGALVLDIYDGSDAFLTGRVVQNLRSAKVPRARIRYEWEQRHADPLTGRVLNAMHFTVTGAGPRQRFEDAFVYDWRLWSVPELQEAMTEAGFSGTEVFARVAEAMDSEGNLYISPIADPSEVGESFSVYVVGRK